MKKLLIALSAALACQFVQAADTSIVYVMPKIKVGPGSTIRHQDALFALTSKPCGLNLRDAKYMRSAAIFLLDHVEEGCWEQTDDPTGSEVLIVGRVQNPFKATAMSMVKARLIPHTWDSQYIGPAMTQEEYDANIQKWKQSLSKSYQPD
ncbi:hypothetical protein C7405_101641 [Paraburkholderia caballeronis]|uniref:hypothetical protein n=1 Tax=Paraburkholderia caballeronis TaxID=416943 RepID=UPI001066C1B3|nr:hypothetical protein [Paraburkholderia caballeronis]TDV39522.1 hypothetical protein C7405_101641 [Paraburkholderia caballeronis]